MPRLIPELESLQARLEDRARAWDETSDTDLESDLKRCEEQMRLLERGIAEFTAALEAIPPALAEERQRASRRITVLGQTRDLTGAYVHVLRGYLLRRGRA